MGEPDITQIAVGKFKVGITGLQDAIEEIKALKIASDEGISQALFDKLKIKNYIPIPAREEYKQAFLREYKKALGEALTEDRQGLIIKILGPGCPSCDKLEQLVMTTMAELNLPAQVEHVRDLQEILSLGVFGTPALMINDEVKIIGAVPSAARLKSWLQEAAAPKEQAE